jgi:hypothetical protein
MQDNGVWRKRYSHELYELFNETDIVKYIKINTLGWTIGIWKTGRPKLRWKDGVI